MSDERDHRKATEGLGDNPLSSDELLRDAFYAESNPRRPPTPERAAGTVKPKPTHYKVISISLYREDLDRLEAMVAELKRRGHTKASKSSLIRYALDQVDLDAVPRGY